MKKLGVLIFGFVLLISSMAFAEEQQIKVEPGNEYGDKPSETLFYYDYDWDGNKSLTNNWYGYLDTTNGPGRSINSQLDGWHVHNGKWVYIENFRFLVNTWKKIRNKWYYFDSDGFMVTGWQSIEGKTYYFNGEGTMVTGLQMIEGTPKLFSDSGELVK